MLGGFVGIPHRSANDEKEGRKHQIRGREAVPCRMAERPVHALEYPGIVNEDHARDGKTPECIQSHEAWSFGLHANSCVSKDIEVVAGVDKSCANYFRRRKGGEATTFRQKSHA